LGNQLVADYDGSDLDYTGWMCHDDCNINQTPDTELNTKEKNLQYQHTDDVTYHDEKDSS
jgi:hypothetical protein